MYSDAKHIESHVVHFSHFCKLIQCGFLLFYCLKKCTIYASAFIHYAKKIKSEFKKVTKNTRKNCTIWQKDEKGLKNVDILY